MADVSGAHKGVDAHPGGVLEGEGEAAVLGVHAHDELRRRRRARERQQVADGHAERAVEVGPQA